MQAKKVLPEEDKWETLKASGFPVELAQAHQAITFFTQTEKTISQAKFPGIKLWWTSAGLMGEFKGRKELIPHAAVARVVF